MREGSVKESIYYGSPAWLQNLLVSAYGYHLYRKRYTGVFHDILALTRQSRNWNRQRAEAWQAEHLHSMVKHCRQNVPFYQKLFADYGLHEQHITSVEDVRKLPILKKATLREDPTPFRSGSSKAYMLQHTSGSTGTPLTLEVDEYTYKLAMALLVDHEESHGVSFGAPRATFAGRMIQPADQLSPPFARYNRAENQMIFSSYHLNSRTFPWYARALKRYNPRELIGYPSAISDLASHYQKTGINPEFRPKAVFTNSETLLSWQREKIESIFECPVYDYYGTAEYMLFAGQESNGRYRLSPLLGIAEVLDENDEPASEGRLIATTLSNRAMPLLRYEIGDSAVAVREATGHSTCHELEKIVGRLDDYLEMPDGRRVGRLDHIFKGLQGLLEAQIIQDSLDHCTINAVFESEPSADQIQILTNNFKTRTGQKMNVTIRPTDYISRGENGKFRSVVRRLDAKEQESEPCS